MSVSKCFVWTKQFKEGVVHQILRMRVALMADEKYSGENHHGPDRLAPYPISRLAPSIELVDMACEIAKADDIISIQATGKLRLLLDQMRGLQDEARTILEETRRNQELHRAHCGFKKIAGRIYYLYRKEDLSLQFSMIAPEEWNGPPPYRFVGAFRLENDMSWTPAKTDEPDGTPL